MLRVHAIVLLLCAGLAPAGFGAVAVAPALPRVTLVPTTVWTAAGSPYRLKDITAVPAGGSLRIEAGVTVLFAAGAVLEARGGTIEIVGEAARPVLLQPEDGRTPWGGLLVSGPAGRLTLRRVDLAFGRIELTDGATGLVEDAHLHDFPTDNPALIEAEQAGSLTLRRVHVQRYFQIAAKATPVLIEDSLFEDILGDGLDLNGAPPGSAIRRSTFRRGEGENVDGIDLGAHRAAPAGPGGRAMTRAPIASRGVMIEQVLIHGFARDKGISIGEGATDIVIRDCVIHDVDVGVAVKDGSSVRIVHTTIVDAKTGVSLYRQATAGAGRAARGRGGAAGTGPAGTTTVSDTIIWNTPTAFAREPDLPLVIDHTDAPGERPPEGEANLNLEPRFLDAAAHDYRLRADSPLLAKGTAGTALGAIRAVGNADLR